MSLIGISYICSAMPENKDQNQAKKRRSAPIDPTYGHLQPQALDIERVVLGGLRVSEEEFLAAEKAVPENVKAAIRQAYDNIYAFHTSSR